MIGVLGDAYNDAQTMNVAVWNRSITRFMIEVSTRKFHGNLLVVYSNKMSCSHTTSSLATKIAKIQILGKIWIVSAITK